MGRAFIMKKQGMHRLFKTCLILLLTLASTVFMADGWYSPTSASAAVSILQNFPATPTVTASATTASGTFTVSTGSNTNRLLLVAVEADSGATNTGGNFTVTYGNQTLTQIVVSDTTQRRISWLGYLKEAGLDAAANTTLAVTASPLAATTPQIRIYATTLDSVNQTTPVGATYSLYNNNTVNNFTYSIAVPAGGYGAFAVTTNNSGTPTITVDTGYTLTSVSAASPNTNYSISASKLYASAGNASPTITYGATFRGAIAAVTINPYVVADATAPTAGTLVINPDNAGYTSSSPTISASFTDPDSAVTSCEYMTDGVTWLPTGNAPTGSSPTWTCTKALTGLTGTVYLNLRAYSNAASPGAAVQQSRIVDATIPSDGVLSAAPGVGQLTLSWTAATDNGSGVNGYILRYAAGTTPPASCSAGSPVNGGTFSAATLSTVHTGLTDGADYSYRLCATDSSGNTSAGATISAKPGKMTSTIQSCAGCHGYTTAFNDGTGRNAPLGLFQGSHNNHVIGQTMTCSVCHIVPSPADSTNYGHARRTVQMAASIGGGTYNKTSPFPVSDTFAPQSCNNTTCHGAASPNWGSNTTNAGCTKCHGVSGTTPAQYTTDNKTAAPGYVSTAPVGTGRSTGGATLATDSKVGAHGAHLAATPNYSSTVACNTCHRDVNPTNATFTGHMNGSGTLVFFGLATTNHATPSYNGTACTNTYCHYGKSITGYSPATVNASVTWTNTAYLSETLPTLTGDCGKCHASPPTGGTSTSHQGITTIGECNGCHSHVNADGTFNNKALHINGAVEYQASCVDCHAKVQNGTHGTPRDIITTEFGLAWGHKKSGRALVADADCIVCHLEGEYATQKPSGTYHKDGNIDLRDPDGAGETPITNNSGAAFTFKRFSTSFAAGSRTTAISNSIADVLTQKFCLACHDSNGAINTTARSNNGGTGTATMPFGGLALGTNYTAANNAIGTQGLVDVKSQFALTNSSRHPVLGSRTRDFPYSTRLAVPYNNIGTARDANGTTGHTTAASVVINCFDCHNTATTPLTTRTVAAHGNAVTLRGTIYATGAVSTLCSTCHTGYTVAGTHGTGSAWALTGSSHNVARNCQDCHGSYGTAAPVRPVRAQDYHGNNAKVGGGLWPTVNSRPYAFIRSWTGTAYHRPYRASEFTTGSATCGAGTCPSGGSGGQVGDGSNRTYGAGGTY